MKTKTTFITTWIFLAILMIFPLMANAQRTLNVSGGTATVSGDVFSYSIGEMVLVSTATTPNHFYTQGVLQNDDVNLTVYDSQYLSQGLELYPNPVANIVYLQPSFPNGGALSLQLYDLRGRLVMQHQAELDSGSEKQQMDLSVLQEGTYLLQATFTQNEKVYKHSFKVIKFSEQ